MLVLGDEVVSNHGLIWTCPKIAIVNEPLCRDFARKLVCGLKQEISHFLYEANACCFHPSAHRAKN
jgi:hypothetical protein